MIVAAFAVLAGGVASAQAPDIIAMLDTNRDGAIQRSEFEAVASANFARMDVNRDGRLTGDERPIHHSQAVEQTQAQHAETAMGMFNSEDTNHDGVISGDEVARFRDHALNGNTPRASAHH